MDIRVKKGKLDLNVKVSEFYSTDVVPFGNSAKINCQKKYIGKKVIVLVLEK